MLILIAAALLLIACGVAAFLAVRLTQVKGMLFASRQTAARAVARRDAARKAAQRATERCEQLSGHLENAIANTQQAISVGASISTVKQQLSELLALVRPEPGAVPGRHQDAATLAGVPQPQAAGLYDHPYPPVAPGYTGPVGVPPYRRSPAA